MRGSSLNGYVPQYRWVLTPCDEQVAKSLAAQLGGNQPLARILANRGLSNHADVERFLNPALTDLHDPRLLPDIDRAADRLLRAGQSGEKVFVFGDYDADGITGTALLVRTLRAIKADVVWRLPHRGEGYDIKPKHISEAAAAGASLVITCDCGSGAFDSAAEASKQGIDVIVTDHHEPPTDVPRFLAVVNPKRRGSEYPFCELAGVGVALKLAQSLVRRLGYDEMSFTQKFLDLVAIGTVGDVAPLLGENRTFVKHGLGLLADTRKIGIRKLLKQAGLDCRPLIADSIAYGIAPRINAAGRMGDPSGALRLLLTRDEAEADKLSSDLERCNSIRKAEQDSCLQEALAMVESLDLQAKRVLVLVGDNWKPGVVGLLAGRIREAFWRPAIVLTRDKASGKCSGSARSIDGFHIRDALSECSVFLERFGGHAQAAGLSLPERHLEAFDAAINEVAAREISDDQLVPRIEYEAELDAREINLELADAVASLEPFGSGNPEPVLVTLGQRITSLQRVGDGSHLKMTAARNGGPTLSCVAFGVGEAWSWLEPGAEVDLCFNLRPNDYGGSRTAQLVVRDIRPASGSEL